MAVTTFKGLNNISDPLRLGLDDLVQADNVEITGTGALRRRDGYASSLDCTPSGAYSTIDLSRTYIIDDGDLVRWNPDLSTTVLKSGLTAAPMYWAEVNTDVYFNNGVDSGIILADDSVIDWSWPMPTAPDLNAVSGNLPAGQYQVACTYLLPDGRETGASYSAAINLVAGQSLQITSIPQVADLRTRVYIAPADSDVFQLAFATTLSAASWNASPDELGIELETQFMSQVPPGTCIAFWGGRFYAMQYLPALSITAVWASQPLGYHLWNLQQDYIPVPSVGLMLSAVDEGLIIGTDQAIHLWNGESLTLLATYGVVPGWCADIDQDKKVWIWTQRGLCKALPFQNVTESRISVAPGVHAGASIVRKNGEKQFIVALHAGGAAFNSRR